MNAYKYYLIKQAKYGNKEWRDSALKNINAGAVYNDKLNAITGITTGLVSAGILRGAKLLNTPLALLTGAGLGAGAGYLNNYIVNSNDKKLRDAVNSAHEQYKQHHPIRNLFGI